VLLSRFIFPIAPEIAITTLGGANNTPDSLALAMLQDKSVILAFDNDQAGIKGEQRLQEHIAKNASPYVLDIAPKFPTGKDATDYYRAGGDLIAWLDSI
jgi:DNA primase